MPRTQNNSTRKPTSPKTQRTNAVIKFCKCCGDHIDTIKPSNPHESADALAKRLDQAWPEYKFFSAVYDGKSILFLKCPGPIYCKGCPEDAEMVSAPPIPTLPVLQTSPKQKPPQHAKPKPKHRPGPKLRVQTSPPTNNNVIEIFEAPNDFNEDEIEIIPDKIIPPSIGTDSEETIENHSRRSRYFLIETNIDEMD